MVGEFVTAAAAVEREGVPKEDEAVWARRHEAGKEAAKKFFNRQHHCPVRREHSFHGARAKAHFGIPPGAGNVEEWIADEVAGDSGDMAERLAKREMVDCVRETVEKLPMSQRQAIRMRGGLGEVPGLDGFEPREPNKDGSGGGRGMRDVEMAPSIGVTPRQAGNLLRQARLTLKEALLEKWSLEDVYEYFPGINLED